MRLWIGLLTTFLGAADPPAPRAVGNPELRQELLHRIKTDQDARMALISWQKTHGQAPRKQNAVEQAAFKKLLTAVQHADSDNTKWLRTTVDKHGWPTYHLVGKDGAHAAWLLVQHADAHPKFQRQCLNLMEKLPRNEVSGIDMAYQTDRVLLAEGKKQRYGTQFTFAGGKWQAQRLEDPAHVDQRRAAIGMQPLTEYVKTLESVYGHPARK